MCENWSDLLVIYSREGGQLELEKQREYITHVAQKIGVSETRSRLGIMDGKSGNWLLEMTNVSNIADWGSNFTTDTQYNSGGSGGDINLILDKMRVYYSSFYKTMNSTADNATANAQVVVWNVPKNAPDFNNVDLQRTILEFRLAFPNVYFLFVGNNRGAYEPVLKDPEEDFFKLDTSNPELFADTLSKRICQIPTVFVYPACDTQNVNFTNYNEQSHKFTGYISPNYTSYAMIAPHNFRFSYRVKLKVIELTVKVLLNPTSSFINFCVHEKVLANILLHTTSASLTE
ncbi:hypothetical protein SK128_007342 [Halocaridina rubra]|uniref:Uncharacterized protein n=1 Tax=Halocaridina rubra TaxID=373956 RepID=A0AAN8WXC7_HALRR